MTEDNGIPVFSAAKNWLDGKVKLPYVKNIILNECHAAARENDGNPAVQAAARTAVRLRQLSMRPLIR
jgi:hypothetical protein